MAAASLRALLLALGGGWRRVHRGGTHPCLTRAETDVQCSRMFFVSWLVGCAYKRAGLTTR